LAPTREAAFSEGCVHLVRVPVDYSENMRVVDDSRVRLSAISDPANSEPAVLRAKAQDEKGLSSKSLQGLTHLSNVLRVKTLPLCDDGAPAEIRPMATQKRHDDIAISPK
jgi:hypothetical protein